MKYNSIIYILNEASYYKSCAKLIETIYQKGNKIQILCQNDIYLKEIDSLLWTYSSTSFIPHGTSLDPFIELQPIFITTNSNQNPNKANVLFLMKKNQAAFTMPNDLTCYTKIVFVQPNIYHGIFNTKFKFASADATMENKIVENINPYIIDSNINTSINFEKKFNDLVCVMLKTNFPVTKLVIQNNNDSWKEIDISS